MEVTGLTKHQSQSMIYSTRSNVSGFDSDNGNTFMDKMITTYTTSYSEEGISCRKEFKNGDYESSKDVWTLMYRNPSDYTKVQKLLNGFGNDDRLTFASQKVFWEDYLGGEMDVDEFKDYYSETQNGIIDFEGKMAKGEKLRDIVNEPYAEYFNNQGFVGHVYTEQEMWDNWYARVEASQKEALAKGAGIEPPTETQIWHWRDGAFGYNVEVYKSEKRKSEYIVKLYYDNGKDEERIVDTDKINASSCSILDLQVKMLSLMDEGKVTQEEYMMDMVIAHFNMEHQYPNADENTMIDFKNIFEKQLDLEMRNGGREKHIERWQDLLTYL